MLPGYYFESNAWTDDATQPETPTVYGVASTNMSEQWMEFAVLQMTDATVAELDQEHQRMQRHYQALRNGTVTAAPDYRSELQSWRRTCEENASACPDGPKIAARRAMYRQGHALLYGISYGQVLQRDRRLVSEQLLPPDAAVARHNVEMMLNFPGAGYNLGLAAQETCQALNNSRERCFQELADVLANGSWAFTADEMVDDQGQDDVYANMIREHARIAQETTVPHLAFTAYASAAFLTTCRDIVQKGADTDLYDRYGSAMQTVVPIIEENVTERSSHHLRIGTCLFAGVHGDPEVSVSLPRLSQTGLPDTRAT